MFWMIGEIYASAMAWAIIPHYGKRTRSYTSKIIFKISASTNKLQHNCFQH